MRPKPPASGSVPKLTNTIIRQVRIKPEHCYRCPLKFGLYEYGEWKLMAECIRMNASTGAMWIFLNSLFLIILLPESTADNNRSAGGSPHGTLVVAGALCSGQSRVLQAALPRSHRGSRPGQGAAAEEKRPISVGHTLTGCGTMPPGFTNKRRSLPRRRIFLPPGQTSAAKLLDHVLRQSREPPPA